MSNRAFQIIGWWQVACGALGLLLFAALGTGLLGGGFVVFYGVINVVLGTIYFCVVVLAGRGLLRRAAWALPLSVGCQAVQILSGSIRGGPHIAIAAGPMLGVTVTNTSVGLAAGVNAAFFFGIQVGGQAWAITINGVALAWTIVLLGELHASRRGTPVVEIAAPVA